MQNCLNTFITNIGIAKVNIVNYLRKTCRRFAPNRTMDISMDKFQKYKSDWNYPVQTRYLEQDVAPDNEYNTFQSAMKLTLAIGQCFGLIPVLGIREAEASKLRFKFVSWRCAYTFISLIGQFIMAALLFLSLFKDSRPAVDCANELIFYCFAFFTTIIYLRIAMRWPKLCMEISKIEAVDPNMDLNLNKKLEKACIIVLTLSLVEHMLFELHWFTLALDCDPDTPLYEGFSKHSFPWMFTFTPYSICTGILSHFFNVQCSFNWNFNTLFVICISIYLTSRLEQINQRIVAAKNKTLPFSFWRTMREDYNRSVHLVRQVDRIIGGVVLVSFACNLFFVCSQLWHSLAEGIKATPRCRAESILEDKRFLHGYEHSIYFAFSFVFLMGRSVAVSLVAARVHEASLEPAQSLYEVSSDTYCVEIERFLDQIHGDTVALSGLQFFQVKRGLVLTVAGTIITYELVLMQFTGITLASPEPISG